MRAKEKISKLGDRLNKFPIIQQRKRWEIDRNELKRDGKCKSLHTQF